MIPEINNDVPLNNNDVRLDDIIIDHITNHTSLSRGELRVLTGADASKISQRLKQLEKYNELELSTIKKVQFWRIKNIKGNPHGT